MLKKKFLTICTPFDEISVKKVIDYNFDFLKIASCSMDEWPLLEHIAKLAKQKKIIASLGGGDDQSIRNIISFFSSKNYGRHHRETVSALFRNQLKLKIQTIFEYFLSELKIAELMIHSGRLIE